MTELAQGLNVFVLGSVYHNWHLITILILTISS